MVAEGEGVLAKPTPVSAGIPLSPPLPPGPPPRPRASLKSRARGLDQTSSESESSEISPVQRPCSPPQLINTPPPAPTNVPPPPPPPLSIDQHAAHAHAAAMLDPSNAMHHQFQATMPSPMVKMLLDEAHAWTALQHLHSSVSQTANSIAAELTAHDVFDEQREATAQREASYAAALTHLGSQSDALFNEIVKLRTILKAKAQIDTTSVASVLRHHANESLALGEALARNGAMGLATATTQIRVCTQALKAQLAQTRALLQAMAEANDLGLPSGSRLVVGLEHEGAAFTAPVETVLASAYAQGADHVTDEALGRVLRHLVVRRGRRTPSPVMPEPDPAPPPPPPPPPALRTFARRSVER